MKKHKVQPEPYLTENGKAIFNRLLDFLDNTKMESVDGFELSVLAQHFDTFQVASQKVNDEGYSRVTGNNGYEQVTPHFTAMKDSANYIMKHAEKFGLNPSAREKMKIFDAKKESNPLDEI
jgi:P27 family predicted phage terminase small subunit